MQVTRTRPLFLNLDDDERLLKPSDMRYAINIETATSYDDDTGALEKSKAPVLVDYTLPLGENKCIGTIVSEQVNNIYIFVYNSNGNHRIYEYNDQYEVTELVMESSELNFTEYNNVVGDAVRGFGDNEILLYFTDDVNPIRQINVQRAKDGGYGSIDQEKISLIRYQPSQAPIFEFTEDPEYFQNNFMDNVYQFRCRYVCLDGEYTAYSAHSELAYLESALASYLNAGEFRTFSNLNNLEVSVPTGSEIVDKIEVIARVGNEGEWFTIKELENNINSSTVTFDFKGEGGYPAANPEQTNKYFDNVPPQAECLRVVSNRLFLGNYVDGYDANPSIEEADASDFSINPRFDSLPEFSTFSVSTSQNRDTNNDTISVVYDYSSFGQFQENDVIRISINEILRPVSGPDISVFQDDFSFIFNANDTLIDALNNLGNQITSSSAPNLVEISNVTYSVLGGSQLKITIYHKNPVSLSAPSIYLLTTESKVFEGSAGYGESLIPESSYKVGIIEYDEAMRPSTVRPIPDGEITVNSLTNEVFPLYPFKGRVSIDYRIANTIQPLPRTKYWSFALTENLTKSEILYYTTTGAYEPNSSDSPNDSYAFYLNMRGLVGKDDSYVATSGAEIDTTFKEGDKLKVVGKMDANGNISYYQTNHVFNILEAQVYEGEDSPIYNNNTSSLEVQTTGYLLKIENREAEGFDRSSINAGTSEWNNAGGSVVFEIYRNKANTLEGDEAYYEVGGINEVKNGKFQGNVRETGDTKTYNVSSLATGTNYLVINADVDLVIGDVISSFNSLNNLIGFSFVVDVIRYDGESYVFTNAVFPNTFSIELAEKTAAGRLYAGDGWYRLRKMRNDNNDGFSAGDEATFRDFPIYDFKPSDFLPYRAWSKGRANAYDPLAQERERRSAITYSEPYFQDVDFNGLSSFNIAKGNFKAFPFDSGPIHRLWNNGNFLMVFQENDVARVPINNRIISTSNQQDSLTLSDDVINQERYYAAGYGLTNKDIFAAIDGRFYGYDIKRGKAWEINGQGHTLISEFKVQSHFDEDSKELVSFHNFIDMSVGIDKENDKVLFGTKSKGADNIVSGSAGPSNSYVPGIATSGGNLVFKGKPQNTKAANMNLSNLNTPLSGYTFPVSNPSTAPQTLTNVVRTGKIQYGGPKQTSGTKNVQLSMPASGGNVTINGTVNLGNGQVTIPTTQSSGNLSLAGNDINYDGFVLGYNYKANRWVSFYSFSPEHFTNINYSIFSFNNGEMFKLNTGNSFPISPVATFETIFNQPRNSVKRFRTLGMATSEDSDNEISAGWDVNLNTNLNSTILSEDLFVKKEGVWRSDLPRTTDVSGTSAAIGLGIVSSKVGNQVFVSGLDTDILGLNIGDLVSNGNDQNIGNITAIGKDNITLSTASGVNQGDFIFAEKPSFIDGDELRGYFLKARFTAKNSNQQEVYSVSVLQQQSNLHHL